MVLLLLYTEFVLRCVWAAGEWSEGARMRMRVQSYTYTAIKVPRNGNKVPRRFECTALTQYIECVNGRAGRQ